VFAFIDCNCLQTSVVGGGPNEGKITGVVCILLTTIQCDLLGGANASRWHHLVQRAFYNGWKSIHGLKHQTVDIAHGLTIDLHGPMSLRRNDLTLLRESDIVNRLREVQNGQEHQYVMFGDSAYKKQSHLTSYFKDDDEIEEHVKWNKRLKAVRIAIE
jgi:hypothetical protein